MSGETPVVGMLMTPTDDKGSDNCTHSSANIEAVTYREG
jgi:hypothetical protein